MIEWYALNTTIAIKQLHIILIVKKNFIVLQLLLLSIQCFIMLDYFGSLRKNNHYKFEIDSDKIKVQTKVHGIIKPFEEN